MASQGGKKGSLALGQWVEIRKASWTLGSALSLRVVSFLWVPSSLPQASCFVSGG